MRSVQRIGNLHPTLQRLFERQRPFFESLRQRLAFDALHHQELDAVLSSNVVQHANVRMIQAGDRLRLAFKTLPQSWVIRKLLRKNLDGDRAVQTRVARAVHLSHSARSEWRNNLVWPESSAGGQCHSGQIIPAEIKSWRQLFVFANERGIVRLPLSEMKDNILQVWSANWKD
jgi:hypothetical protein